MSRILPARPVAQTPAAGRTHLRRPVYLLLLQITESISRTGREKIS